MLGHSCRDKEWAGRNKGRDATLKGSGDHLSIALRQPCRGQGWDVTSLENCVFLDDKFPYGGGRSGPSCQACKRMILPSDRTKRVEFRSDPDGSQGLTGEYHWVCSRPFASLAHVINLNPWGGF